MRSLGRKNNIAVIKLMLTLFKSLRYRGNNIYVRIYRAYVKRCGRVNTKIVLFSSSPDYSDNAKALCEYLCARGADKEYHFYYIVNDVSKWKKEHNNYKITFINSQNSYGGGNVKYLKELLTAGMILYTHNAPYPCEKKHAVKGQKFIKLWHGCGYKDNQVDLKKRMCNFDLALVPGRLFVATKMRFWNAPEEKILACGYPRYDWLLKPSDEAMSYATSMKGNKLKMIIWMPTFRNDKNNYFNESDSIKQFPLISSEKQWEELDAMCKNENILLLIKLHQYQRDYLIHFDAMSNIMLITNKDFEVAGINMYEFISQTDALISDYSSIAIDYLLLDKPIAFALEDYEQYQRTRGFVFENPLEYMPGHHLYSFDDLRLFINDVKTNNDPFKANRLKVREKAIHESKCYCREISQRLNLICH